MRPIIMTRFFPGAIAGLLMLFSLSVHASGFDSTKLVLDFGNRVMMDISQARLDDAWRKMKAHSNIPPSGIDNFGRQYRAHHDQVIRHFGPAVGVELMKTEMAGQSFLRATYLVKYESTAITWFMIFYKVRDTWVLNEFNYDILSNANFIVTSMEANTPAMPSLSQAWQSETEARLARIEQQGGLQTPVIAPRTGSDEATGLSMFRAVEAGSSNAASPAENEQTLARLELLEQRQERLEQSREVLQPDGNIGGTVADIDTTTLGVLRQIEERLASLEEKYEVIVGQVTTSPLVASPYADEALDRLTSLELRVESLADNRRSSPGAEPSSDELAAIWELLEVLKKQHPFTDFSKLKH
jgi:hypothetical protein